MYSVAAIAVDKAACSFDKLYDYRIPERLGGVLLPGCRVIVPFGGANRKRQGIVLNIFETPDVDGLKQIHSILDEKPLIGSEMLRIIYFLKETTFCTYYDAVKAVIPAGVGFETGYAYRLAAEADQAMGESEGEHTVSAYLKGKRKPVPESVLLKETGVSAALLSVMEKKGVLIKSETIKRKILDEKITMARVAYDYIDGGDDRDARFTAKQQSVLSFLRDSGCASIKEICYFCAVTRTVTDNLAGAGVIEYFEKEAYRNPYADRHAGGDNEPIELNAEQQSAYEGLKRLFDDGRFETSLLFGVTGSGKTSVFHKLIQYVLSKGRQVIVMVPEISLTPQTIDGFHKRFGGRVAVLHSGLTLAERMDEWKRVNSAQADIVVGTRSAVFAPLSNIGLIVIDEEQEHTYRSEKSPRFHAREVAKLRCEWHNAQLLLCSATPAIETYYHAEQKKYNLFSIKKRYFAAKLPDVYIIDMIDERRNASTSAVSQRLRDEIAITLERGEQTMLLLNRRGYNTMVKCGACGVAATCPNCSVALTYHTANNRLICHYCGYTRDLLENCAICGGSCICYHGVGTQRAEEQLRAFFPLARILRMDLDTTMSRFSHERLFADFRAGKYDIMIGTQMMAKGLDFPNVTLVGVLCADQSLYAQDFRSFERAFGLITQVVGRCGRSNLPGRAYIQTFTPDSRVIELAASQRYEDFYKDEIAMRKLALYPPFCRLCTVFITSDSASAAQSSAERFLQELSQLAATEFPELPLRVLGPAPAGIFKISGRYRFKLLIKCRNSARFRRMMSRLLGMFYSDARNRNVKAFADMYCDGEG